MTARHHIMVSFFLSSRPAVIRCIACPDSTLQIRTASADPVTITSPVASHARHKIRPIKLETQFQHLQNTKQPQSDVIRSNIAENIHTISHTKLTSTYTGCPRRKGQNFGRVFLMLKYTDITQNTYIQSWTVTEIMAREKCGLLAGLRTVPCQLTAYRMSVPDCRVRLQKYRWRSYISTPLWLTACHV